MIRSRKDWVNELEFNGRTNSGKLITSDWTESDQDAARRIKFALSLLGPGAASTVLSELAADLDK